MFTLTRLPVQSTSRAHVRLPLRILLAIPGQFGSAQSQQAFNVAGAINDLMGSAGWKRATKVFAPSMWAPAWIDPTLAKFVSAPSARSRRLPLDLGRTLRVKTFPGLGPAVPARRTLPRYEIVHLLAGIKRVAGAAEPMLKLAKAGPWLGFSTPSQVIGSGFMRDLLVAIDCRLLILQVASGSHEDAVLFGRHVTAAGGPATVVVSGGTRLHVNRYFLDLYADIVHNKPLDVVAAPRDPAQARALKIDAILAEGNDDDLQFDRWLQELRSKIEGTTTLYRGIVKKAIGKPLTFLHENQKRDLQAKVLNLALPRKTPIVVQDLSRLETILERIDWAHETGGALPLSEVSEAAAEVEATATAFSHARITNPKMLRQLRTTARKMAAAAPRVLNANFRDPRRERTLGISEALDPGKLYELVVDVGPRWADQLSAVRGQAEFPVESLPPGKAGYRVRVVLFSDDFSAADPGTPARIPEEPVSTHESGEFEPVTIPPLTEGTSVVSTDAYQVPVAAADIWVPRSSGQSFPFVGDRRSKTAGPVRLRVFAPTLRRGSRALSSARGRLSLYYENNLVQSAVVEFGLETNDRIFQNAVTVDYVLSGSLADLGRYATRVFELDGKAQSYTVGLNIATNSDGAGGHRLMIADRSDLTVSLPYDPRAAGPALETSRLKLKECFVTRDANCVTQGTASALDANNGKTLKQFKCDLFQLAWYGSDLFTQAFGQLSIPNVLQYLQKLRQALAKRTVIQVARTGMAQYVYPWAMVYDIPLPNRTIPNALKWCKVLAEWDAQGVRKLEAGERCPYHATAEHQQDVLCPYGFWGLKHYIEQPINVQADGSGPSAQVPPVDVLPTVKIGNPVSLGLGVTRDVTLDAKALQTHLTRIQKLAAYTPANGATEWAEVQVMLQQPDVAYFLCHGERESNGRPYLGVGPKDKDPRHRVYPEQLLAWAQTIQDFWKDRHPLVFINGCHTADLKPGEILSFVKTFADFGASAVIGTEVSIRLPLAAEVAESLLHRVLVKSEAVGAAIHAVRWDLANKGNLLGLAYTPYCLSGLRLVQAP